MTVKKRALWETPPQCGGRTRAGRTLLSTWKLARIDLIPRLKDCDPTRMPMGAGERGSTVADGALGHTRRWTARRVASRSLATMLWEPDALVRPRAGAARLVRRISGGTGGTRGGTGMLTEPGATIVRGVLVAASLGAVGWSGKVLAGRHPAGHPAISENGRQPRIRSVLADLVFKSHRRGSAPTDWPQLVRPRVVENARSGAPQRGPQPEFWMLPPGIPAVWPPAWQPVWPRP